MIRYHVLRKIGPLRFQLKCFVQSGHVGPILESYMESRSLGYLKGMVPVGAKKVLVPEENVEVYEEVLA